MSLPLIELDRLCYRFGRFQAVDGVNLAVRAGDIFGFLGLNGAGKTTTLRLILGLLRPEAGGVRIFGQPANGGQPQLLRRVGVLFEDFAAYSYLSGRQHLRLHASLFGWRGSELDARVDEWLRRVGLGESGARKTRQYSLGMLRRLGVACALVHSPELVFLDEPTNGLDPQGIHDLRVLIQELNQEGTTFFLSSHILGEVEKVCNRVGIIHRGRLMREGEVGEMTGSGREACHLRVKDADAARRLLASASWCKGVRLLPEGNGAPGASLGGVLEVRLPESEVPRMVREVAAAGIDVQEVRPVVKSLEDVFRETVAGAPEGELEDGEAPS